MGSEPNFVAVLSRAGMRVVLNSDLTPFPFGRAQRDAIAHLRYVVFIVLTQYRGPTPIAALG